MGCGLLAISSLCICLLALNANPCAGVRDNEDEHVVLEARHTGHIITSSAMEVKTDMKKQQAQTTDMKKEQGQTGMSILTPLLYIMKTMTMPMTLDAEEYIAKGVKGVIHLKWGAEPQIECASTYAVEEEMEEGETAIYERGVGMRSAHLTLDIEFVDLDLEGLLDHMGLPNAFRILGDKLHGSVQVLIDVPMQRIGYEYTDNGNWEINFNQEDALRTHLTLVTEEGAEKSRLIQILQSPVPDWASWLAGKALTLPTNENPVLLDFLVKSPEIGFWSKIGGKIEEGLDSKLSGVGIVDLRDFFMSMSTNRYVRKAADWASYLTPNFIHRAVGTDEESGNCFP
mmetsp:Transcript_20771/g.44300  ORF Transcript_20771/g.44300 Transcript_20771/m.44300 type:complete len:342 (+) Transcript_20771:98-1123(+)